MIQSLINLSGIEMRIAQIFGANLKRLRNASKISQRQLCDDLNVSVPTLIRWEKGENMPREEGQIDDLAAYLKVPPESLFQRPTDAPIEPRDIKPSRKEVLMVINELAAKGELVIKLRPKT